MWLATVWCLAGVAESLGFRPRGVHRPEPVVAADGSGFLVPISEQT